MTNQKQIRAAFWVEHPQFKRKGNTRQNKYCADIRMAFIDFVEMLYRNGDISDKLTQKVTL